MLAVSVGAEAKPGYEVHASGTMLILPVEKSADYVIAILANERQRVQLVVKSPSSMTEYSTKGHVSEHGIQADFGAFGRINVRLHLVQHPGEPRHKGRCKGRAPLYQDGTYQGSIEFSQEGGVPEVSVERGHVYFERRFRQLCKRPQPSIGGDKGSTHTVEVGILTLAGRTQGRTIFLQAVSIALTRNPRYSTGNLEVAAHERREGVRVTQRISVSVDHESLAMSPRGKTSETVEVAPPGPFAGHALYTRRPASSPSWTGDLTVDLPDGDSVPLVSADFTAVFCRGFSIATLRQCLGRSRHGSALTQRYLISVDPR
jgi:hypothetical protein